MRPSRELVERIKQLSGDRRSRWHWTDNGNLTARTKDGYYVTIFETETGTFRYVCDGEFSNEFGMIDAAQEEAERIWL